MRFMIEYPLLSRAGDGEWLRPESIAAVARAAEEAGVDAIALTDHPAPSRKWLEGGGHETLDPFVGLAYLAAATTRLTVMTYLAVVPYRNPFLTAKSMTALDVVSGGRTIFVLGTGYLRSEFAALGVDFAERNDLFDEALRLLDHVWTDDEVTFEGRHFRAVGQASRPAPVQRPRPPLWVGGNSARARARVAAHGQGWAPMVIDRGLATTTRTEAIESLEDLRVAIGDLRARVEAAGRDPGEVDVQVQWHAASRVDGDPREALRLVEQLARVGVTWLVLNPPGDDVERCLDLLAGYADRVVRQARDG